MPPPEIAPVSSPRLGELLRDDAGGAFPKALAPRVFTFPDDHGPHPAYRNEWWYLTGNLDGPAGGRFGYELTIFRFRLAPDEPPALETDWRTHQVYIGHFAITDVARGDFHVAERYARAAAGLAGAEAEPFRVWVEDWSISAREEGGPGEERWQVRAADGDRMLRLDLDAVKAPVLNGEAGLSRKSAEEGNASYYYSISRLATTGEIRIGGETFAVSGYSWLDREWGSSALAADQVGWDWFALQFESGDELMFYNIRRGDGSADPYSAGTWVAADGATTSLSRDDVVVQVTDTWENERGDRYPSGWRIDVPSLGARLRIEPALANQELETLVRYWEGAVDVSGTIGTIGTITATPVAGRGYVELTGYAAP